MSLQGFLERNFVIFGLEKSRNESQGKSWCDKSNRIEEKYIEMESVIIGVGA